MIRSKIRRYFGIAIASRDAKLIYGEFRRDGRKTLTSRREEHILSSFLIGMNTENVLGLGRCNSERDRPFLLPVVRRSQHR